MPGLEISFLQGNDCYRDYRLAIVKNNWLSGTDSRWMSNSMERGNIACNSPKNMLSSLTEMCNAGLVFRQILIIFIADKVVS